MPITDVALACGFVSPPHFTKCYHERQGRSPSEERRMRRQRLLTGNDHGNAQPAPLIAEAVPPAPDQEYHPLQEVE